jgi:hypothetical protein
LPLAQLTSEEGIVFRAEVDAAIEESLTQTNYGEILRAAGIATVALDESGNIVRYPPA